MGGYALLSPVQRSCGVQDVGSGDRREKPPVLMAMPGLQAAILSPHRHRLRGVPDFAAHVQCLALWASAMATPRESARWKSAAVFKSLRCRAALLLMHRIRHGMSSTGPEPKTTESSPQSCGRSERPSDTRTGGVTGIIPRWLMSGTSGSTQAGVKNSRPDLRGLLALSSNTERCCCSFAVPRAQRHG